MEQSERGKIFYKMRLMPDENGLLVWTDEWISIQESRCFHYCVKEYDKGRIDRNVMRTKGTPLHVAKSSPDIVVKRISKSSSRFAFDTKEKAFAHLLFMKRRQLKHIKRDVEFITKFLSVTDSEESLLGLKKDGDSSYLVPDTKELVNQHYIFD